MLYNETMIVRSKPNYIETMLILLKSNHFETMPILLKSDQFKTMSMFMLLYDDLLSLPLIKNKNKYQMNTNIINIL